MSLSSYDIKLAEVKAISISTMLLGLNLQGDITAHTYDYLNDEILWILHNIIREIYSSEPQENN